MTLESNAVLEQQLRSTGFGWMRSGTVSIWSGDAFVSIVYFFPIGKKNLTKENAEPKSINDLVMPNKMNKKRKTEGRVIYYRFQIWHTVSKAEKLRTWLSLRQFSSSSYEPGSFMQFW